MQSIIRLDLGSVNSYLLPVKTGFILVDTGGWIFMEKKLDDKRAILEEKLRASGCTPSNLQLVILTHGDTDHIANCHWLQKDWGARIILHKDDLDLVHDLSVEKILGNFKFQSPVLALMGRIMRPLFNKLSWAVVARYQEFKVDEAIVAGHDLSQYGLDAEIIHLPGHTHGSIGILLDSGELISGDSLTNTKKPGLAINAFDFKRLRDSVKSLQSRTITTVYPGHGKPFAFTDLRLS